MAIGASYVSLRRGFNGFRENTRPPPGLAVFRKDPERTIFFSTIQEIRSKFSTIRTLPGSSGATVLSFTLKL